MSKPIIFNATSPSAKLLLTFSKSVKRLSTGSLPLHYPIVAAFKKSSFHEKIVMLKIILFIYEIVNILYRCKNLWL